MITTTCRILWIPSGRIEPDRWTSATAATAETPTADTREPRRCTAVASRPFNAGTTVEAQNLGSTVHGTFQVESRGEQLDRIRHDGRVACRSRSRSPSPGSSGRLNTSRADDRGGCTRSLRSDHGCTLTRVAQSRRAEELADPTFHRVGRPQRVRRAPTKRRCSTSTVGRRDAFMAADGLNETSLSLIAPRATR